MDYLPFLETVHGLLRPERYLEIGVRNGNSLALARCRTVGIDPAYGINTEINCDVALFRTTSDEYFTRPEPLAPTGGRAFDLAFIDGMHLFEFALRDFIYAERYSTPHSVIVFDDVLPRSVDEAARVRHTIAWTGDVYSVLAVLAKYRPELTVVPVGTLPTGLLVVFGLDPAYTVLADNYDQIMAEFRHADPQPVPPALLDRMTVVAPERLLQADFWEVLAGAAPDATADQLQQQLAPRVEASLGAAFVPRPAVSR